MQGLPCCVLCAVMVINELSECYLGMTFSVCGLEAACCDAEGWLLFEMQPASQPCFR